VLMHVEQAQSLPIRTMASRQRSTRNKASPVDCLETLSSVCFETWHSREAVRNHAVLGNTAGMVHQRAAIFTAAYQ
jgi:hypothetical protein